MLAMQVPEGEASAGMVHHKMHDLEWTGLGRCRRTRIRSRASSAPVSTAATLNLAATAAQCRAHLEDELDPRSRPSASRRPTRAWTAAKAEPELVPATRAASWAAAAIEDADAERRVLLGRRRSSSSPRRTPRIKPSLAASPYGDELAGVDGAFSAMTWGQVDGLGAISLRRGRGSAHAAEREGGPDQADRHRRQVPREVIGAEGYRTPLPRRTRRYPWGSNSFVLNNMVVLALAHDFTGAQKYFDGVASGADYLLGRNPMDKSYVTGYGETRSRTRIIASGRTSWTRRSSAPPGAVSGGPNSGLRIPVAKEALDATEDRARCVPQKCYIDHIEAWSANEITINWNSPLAWTVAWLDEKARASAQSTRSAVVGREDEGGGRSSRQGRQQGRPGKPIILVFYGVLAAPSSRARVGGAPPPLSAGGRATATAAHAG